jgi:hypothetical protein
MRRISSKRDDIATDEESGLKVRYNRHPKRQNNIVVAAMYSAYQSGMSLEEIGNLYRKSRQAVYDLFRSRGYPLRSKQKKGLVRRFGIDFTLDGNGFLRGTSSGKRVYLHRMVWEEKNGPLPPKHVLTFRDGNRTNVDIENLELVSMKMMGRRFNPDGHNQFTTSGAAEAEGEAAQDGS